MKLKLGVTLAAAGLAGFALVGPGQADPGFDNKYPEASRAGECQLEGDKLEYFGPLKMWPPNHKLQSVSFVATNGTGGPVNLTVTPAVTDIVGGDGGLRHDPDVVYDETTPTQSGTGSVDFPMQLRSERSGKGEGRTYTLQAKAQFDALRSCELEVEVLVPHDMRGGADWNR